MEHARALIFSTLILANSVTELNGGSSDAEVDFNDVAAHALISQDTSQCNIGDEDSTDASSEEDSEELEATSEDAEETIEAASVDEQADDSTDDENSRSE